MSLERTYHCDGPANPDVPRAEGEPLGDRCPKSASTAAPDPSYLPGGFLRVTQSEPGGGTSEWHFCDWDCVLRFAGEQPRTEYVT